MDTIILGFLFALGKIIVLHKVFGLPKVLWFEKWVDLFFTIILPILFMGTYSGAILAIFSGLWLSVLLRVSRLLVQPVRPDWLERWRPRQSENVGPYYRHTRMPKYRSGKN